MSPEKHKDIAATVIGNLFFLGGYLALAYMAAHLYGLAFWQGLLVVYLLAKAVTQVKLDPKIK